MTFHPPAWHTPPDGRAGVTRHVPRGSDHDITSRTGAAAVSPSDLCGAVSYRDRCGRRTSGRSRGACRLGAGNNVPHSGVSTGVLRAYVSRARGRGARGVLESRVRKAQPRPTCVLVDGGQGFLGAALLPRRVKFARAARSAQTKREGWQKSFSRAPITSPPTIRSDPHGMSKLNRNMCVRQFPSSSASPTPRSVTTSCFRLACL
jgi:hypothetical protein